MLIQQFDGANNEGKTLCKNYGGRLYLHVSIQEGSDTPAMGPETDKDSQSPHGRKVKTIHDLHFKWVIPWHILYHSLLPQCFYIETLIRILCSALLIVSQNVYIH